MEEIKDREKYEAGLHMMQTILGSKFFYDQIADIKNVRELMVDKSEREIQDYLKTRPQIIHCRNCSNPAEFIEKHKFDPFYKRPVCFECRDKLIRTAFARRVKRSQGDQNNYVVTADEARAKSLEARAAHGNR